MISQILEQAIVGATQTAIQAYNPEVCPEHILYSLSFEPTFSNALAMNNVSVQDFQKGLRTKILNIKAGRAAFPMLSRETESLIAAASTIASTRRAFQTEVKDFISAIYKGQSGFAYSFLTAFNLKENFLDAQKSASATYEETDGSKKFTEIKGCENMTKAADDGRYGKLIGRSNELKRVVHVLARYKKNNPILVGEAGVGKTAIAEGLALAIHDGDVPDVLKDAEMFSLEVGSLVAGTSFRGQFEEKLEAIIEEIKSHPNAILFVDEVHNLVNAGAVSGGALDASNILKPALASGLRCIGATTYSEYRNIMEKSKAFVRRFQKIDITEPSIDEVVDILNGISPNYEKHHGIKYGKKALSAIVDLSSRYISDRFLPDKAIDIMDETGSYVKLELDKKKVDIKDIESVVSRIARVPVQAVSTPDSQSLLALESNLCSVIYGQKSAIETVSSAIRLSRAGLSSETRPVGSFLFSGPTGVGKTELAKQIAHVMGMRFVRFDMSEYMEKHAVSKFIGAPPGYVGFDQGGELVEAVIKNPCSVVLLDEIEKAHPDIYNVLLQVMDYATLTDNSGRKADFRNCIIIMTTNAGAFEIVKRSVGFGGGTQSVSGKEVIERTFTPEFRNRLDAWVPFNRLDKSVIGLVAEKCLANLQAQLSRKNIDLDVSDDAKDWLIENGYDEQNGARPMERLVDRKIRRKIADDILFGALKGGNGIVVVQCVGGELSVFSHKKKVKPEEVIEKETEKTDEA